MEKENLMCNEVEVVKIVNSTMLPEIKDLQHSIETLSIKVEFVINDARKEREQMKVDLNDAMVEIKSLRKILYGNGDNKPGIIGRLDSIENWVGDMKKFIGIVVGAIVVQVIAFVFLVVQHVFTTQ